MAQETILNDTAAGRKAHRKAKSELKRLQKRILVKYFFLVLSASCD